MQYDDKIIRVALNICERRLRDIDDIIDDPVSSHNIINKTADVPMITEKEWEILAGDEKSMDKFCNQLFSNLRH
jgi:hypothetical protein